MKRRPRWGATVAIVVLGVAAVGCGSQGAAADGDDTALPSRADAAADAAESDAGCAPGLGSCASKGQIACNTSLATDPLNCGSCDRVCGSANTDAVSCAAGACVLKCTAGHGDCDGDPRTGCETSIVGNDPTNCGACGHSCQGGECKAGQCQRIPLVTGLVAAPNDLAIDGVTVFFAANGAISSCLATGCGNSPATIISGQTGEGRLHADPYALMSGGRIYWGATASTGAGPTRGCYGTAGLCKPGSGLGYFDLDTAPYPAALAVDPSFLYWSSGATIQRKNKYDLNSPATFASSGAAAMAVDKQTLVWGALGTGGLLSCKTGAALPCTPSTLVPSVLVDAIALDATNVVYVSHVGATGSVSVCARAGCSPTPTTLAGGVTKPFASSIASDGKTVYFSSGMSAIKSCAVGGCAMAPTNVVTGETALSAIAVDDKFVYWASGGVTGSIFKIAK